MSIPGSKISPNVRIFDCLATKTCPLPDVATQHNQLTFCRPLHLDGGAVSTKYPNDNECVRMLLLAQAQCKFATSSPAPECPAASKACPE